MRTRPTKGSAMVPANRAWALVKCQFTLFALQSQSSAWSREFSQRWTHAKMPSIHVPAFLAALSVLAFSPPAARAQAVEPTFADLATLADGAPLAVRVKVKDQATVAPERAPGLAPGHARLYVEAETLAVLAGSTALPESLRYLVDVPLNLKGKPPKLKKQEFLLFARTVPGRPSELQLVGRQGQLAYSSALEQRLRPVLAAFAAADTPPRVTGIRDVLSSSGNLAGESETQVFLSTADGEPAALTVVRRPGMAPRWGVSWTELVDQSAQPAQRDTLDWYRLACGLPATLPASANLAEDPADRARAAQDYRFVIQQLGPCTRNLN